MKTSELIGPALDWAVELAKGAFWSGNGYFVFNNPDGSTRTFERNPEWRYSTNWEQGGPIIEREGIQWCHLNGQIEAWSGFDYIDWRTNWDSEARMPEGSGFGTGHAILTAAMRCYVASKLGDEVDVPEELCV